MVQSNSKSNRIQKASRPPLYLNCILRKATHGHRRDSGFTLIELFVVLVIIGLLAAIAMFGYKNYVEKARIVRAMSEVITIVKDIKIFTVENNRILPPTLSDINSSYTDFRDPWNNPYQYHVPPVRLKSDGITLLNSEFDVYSMGPDGRTNILITHPDSLDDIIRADDDQYVGLASRYQN